VRAAREQPYKWGGGDQACGRRRGRRGRKESDGCQGTGAKRSKRQAQSDSLKATSASDQLKRPAQATSSKRQAQSDRLTAKCSKLLAPCSRPERPFSNRALFSPPPLTLASQERLRAARLCRLPPEIRLLPSPPPGNSNPRHPSAERQHGELEGKREVGGRSWRA